MSHSREESKEYEESEELGEPKEKFPGARLDPAFYAIKAIKAISVKLSKHLPDRDEMERYLGKPQFDNLQKPFKLLFFCFYMPMYKCYKQRLTTLAREKRRPIDMELEKLQGLIQALNGVRWRMCQEKTADGVIEDNLIHTAAKESYAIIEAAMLSPEFTLERTYLSAILTVLAAKFNDLSVGSVAAMLKPF